MKGKFALTVMVAMVLVIALSYFPACAKSTPEPSEQKSPIVIGILEDMSGPMGGGGSMAVAGENDAIRYINEELGGVAGHPIETITIDYKMDGTLALTGWDRLKNASVPVIMSFFSAPVVFLHEAANTDLIPMVVASATNSQLFPQTNIGKPGYSFSTFPGISGVMDFFFHTVENEWREEEKGRTPKVGIDSVSIGITLAVFSKKSRLECEKRGWAYTSTVTPLAPADVTTQVLQMMEFGADYILTMNSEAAMIVWIKELSRQDYQVVFCGTNAAGSPEVWNSIGEECAGTRAIDPVPQWWDTHIAGIKLMHKLNTKWHPDVESRSSHYIRGFSAQLMVAEALKRALSDVGYENLNGEAVQKAMETLKDFDPIEAGIGYTYTPDDHQGLHGAKWYAWTNEGTREPVSDEWYTVPAVPQNEKTSAYWYED